MKRKYEENMGRKCSTLQNPVLSFICKIQQSQHQLRQWSKLKFKNRSFEFKQLQNKLMLLRTSPTENVVMDEIRSAERQIDRFLIE